MDNLQEAMQVFANLPPQKQDEALELIRDLLRGVVRKCG